VYLEIKNVYTLQYFFILWDFPFRRRAVSFVVCAGGVFFLLDTAMSAWMERLLHFCCALVHVCILGERAATVLWPYGVRSFAAAASQLENDCVWRRNGIEFWKFYFFSSIFVFFSIFFLVGET